MNIIEYKECYASEHQRELLKEIFKFLLKSSIYLTGDTCLSVFYLNHRKSKDIDIFFTKKIDLLKFVSFFRKFQTEIIIESSRFCSYMSKNIKLNFVYESSRLLSKLKIIKIDDTFIRLDTLENITINKIKAIATRYDVKDLFDLGILFSNYFTENEFIKFYKKAMKKEDNLKDFLYITGVFKTAIEAIKNNKKELLLKEDNNFDQTLEKLSKTFNKLIESLIKINFNLYKHNNNLKI